MSYKKNITDNKVLGCRQNRKPYTVNTGNSGRAVWRNKPRQDRTINIYTHKETIKQERWNNPTFYVKELEPSDMVKYLGVVIDAKLSWINQVETIGRKTCAPMWATRQICGIIWGIKSKILQLLYTVIVKQRIINATLFWWKRTGAMRTTPIRDMEMIQYNLTTHMYTHRHTNTLIYTHT